MEKKIIYLVLLISQFVFSQNKDAEQFPRFNSCDTLHDGALKKCFFGKIQEHFYTNFNVPSSANSYIGNVYTLFEVDTLGRFKILYIDAVSNELKDETKRVFELLENAKPATHLGKKIVAKYSISIPIPLEVNSLTSSQQELVMIQNNKKIKNELNELDNLTLKEYENDIFKGNNLIPFSHLNYNYFDSNVNRIGQNNHTASKPYSYAEVAKYYDFDENYSQIAKGKNSWAGKKLWNENFVVIKGDDYWFSINPILNTQLGKDFGSENNFTYVNTRGASVQGQLGNQLSFSTSLYESQGLFADYYNEYSKSIKPSGGNPAIIPGIGIAKAFKENAFDFPLAEANIKYTANKFIDLQLGYSRNFIGDGYRSLLHGDGASPYPFFKINTSFWKIKYTNTYLWLKDVRDEATIDGTYATKFMANHYLSWNINSRLNVGFFESVVWANTNDRGFDANFINPIIFYRAVEFSSSSKTGNALLGLSSKYKFSNNINLYGQFLLDEFAIGDVKAGNKSWRNKFGYQIGAKYFNAFKIQNLNLQLEYNHLRPYVYSHSNVLTNYGHNNMSMGHNWGANFKELIAIARYTNKRFFAETKLIIAERGLDFNDGVNNNNYGGNIYLDYDDNRPFDEGVEVGQGNTTKLLIADLQAGYILNPSSNMKLFVNLMYRNFKPTVENNTTNASSTTWFLAGIKTDLFNWYFDY